MITAKQARELLEYDPDTGVLTWKRRAEVTREDRIFNARFAEKPAGYRDVRYVSVRIGKVNYYAHRLIWLIVTGKWPDAEIDHANREGHDNRLFNLREATHSQNSANRKTRATSKSGVKGVRWHDETKKWMAYIRINGRQVYLGLFSTVEAASAAYAKAASDTHAEFARTK
jgi:HNH endonuclease/AP2 domain